MAHAEFEFIHNRVRAARQALVKIREQLNDHTGNVIEKSRDTF